MTCIVGLVDEQKNIWIGGDSAGVDGWDLSLRADPKVFRNGPFLIGYTSSFRMGQLLRYKLMPPLHFPGSDIFRYFCVDFIDAVRSCLREGGYAQAHNGQESGGTFLVGYQGRLFTIEGDFQVAECRDGYDAAGCGANVARGALYATAGRAPEERIRIALEAAERHCAGVRGPFIIEKLEV